MSTSKTRKSGTRQPASQGQGSSPDLAPAPSGPRAKKAKRQYTEPVRWSYDQQELF